MGVQRGAVGISGGSSDSRGPSTLDFVIFCHSLVDRNTRPAWGRRLPGLLGGRYGHGSSSPPCGFASDGFGGGRHERSNFVPQPNQPPPPTVDPSEGVVDGRSSCFSLRSWPENHGRLPVPGAIVRPGHSPSRGQEARPEITALSRLRPVRCLPRPRETKRTGKKKKRPRANAPAPAPRLVGRGSRGATPNLLCSALPG